MIKRLFIITALFCFFLSTPLHAQILANPYILTDGSTLFENFNSMGTQNKAPNTILGATAWSVSVGGQEYALNLTTRELDSAAQNVGFNAYRNNNQSDRFLSVYRSGVNTEATLIVGFQNMTGEEMSGFELSYDGILAAFRNNKNSKDFGGLSVSVSTDLINWNDLGTSIIDFAVSNSNINNTQYPYWLNNMVAEANNVTYYFETPIQNNEIIYLKWDAENIDAWSDNKYKNRRTNVGIDNLAFRPIIPEPSTYGFIAVFISIIFFMAKKRKGLKL